MRRVAGEFLDGYRRSIYRLRLDDDTCRELEQQLKRWLFMSTDARPAGITKYSGRGSLASWIAVVGTRMAVKDRMRHGQPAERATDDAVRAGLAADGVDPELSYLKACFRDAFRRCFGEALSALEQQQRQVLRMHYVDGLNVDHVGAVLAVHRATAARRIARARGELLTQTRRRMMSSLAIDQREFDSIMALIESRLELTFRSMAPC